MLGLLLICDLLKLHFIFHNAMLYFRHQTFRYEGELVWYYGSGCFSFGNIFFYFLKFIFDIIISKYTHIKRTDEAITGYNHKHEA